MKSQIQKIKDSYFFSQPHQLFFMLGVINAMIMMLIFAFNYKGILELQIDTLTFHVYSLIFTVFTNFFTGFLFTTYPRFCQYEVIDKNYYSKIFYANLIGSFIFLIGSCINYDLVLSGVLILFISQIFIVLKLQNIYTMGSASIKDDPFWILIAQYFGVFSHFLFILVLLGLNIQNIAINIAFYMYIVFLTFSVAQRMIPFFSHSYEPRNENFIKFVFLLFVFKTIFSFLDFQISQIVVDILLALYLLKEFMNYKLPLFKSPAILWVLHLGLFWLPTALFISAITNMVELFFDVDFYFLSIHLLAIGFVTTILIGFGTRVTLGHAGKIPDADNITKKIFWFIQIVVVLRFLYSLNIAFGWGANFLFDISFSAWILLFLVWSIKYAKILLFR